MTYACEYCGTKYNGHPEHNCRNCGAMEFEPIGKNTGRFFKAGFYLDYEKEEGVNGGLKTIRHRDLSREDFLICYCQWRDSLIDEAIILAEWVKMKNAGCTKDFEEVEDTLKLIYT